VAERSYQSRVTDEAEFTRLRLLLAEECERAEQATGDTIKGKRGRLPAQVCTRPGCGKTSYPAHPTAKYCPSSACRQAAFKAASARGQRLRPPLPEVTALAASNAPGGSLGVQWAFPAGE
jgi:hypothetical protein